MAKAPAKSPAKTAPKTAKAAPTVGFKGNSGNTLVIVESPSKAKTINKYLGPGYTVKASVGHVRDLPSKNPKGVKDPVPGVDIENGFEPHYEVDADKKTVISELKKLVKAADHVYLATDLDREGEAIAWHLCEALGLDPATTPRVEFNEITKAAIQQAFANPRLVQMDRVNAQQARRILDRIVGYMASPFLWKKVGSGLSAGRVQSVAVRLLVDREQEIRNFLPDESWQVSGRFTLDAAKRDALAKAWGAFMAEKDAKGKNPTQKAQSAKMAELGALKAELVELGGKKFDLSTTKEEAKDLEKNALAVADAVGLSDIKMDRKPNPEGKGLGQTLRLISGVIAPGVAYKVKAIESKPVKNRPYPPFITSTLQMTASSFLGFNPRRTMQAAQKLYEGGYITYMRTDSTNLSGDALNMARSYISEHFGAKYLPEKPNFYATKDENAQEAHEAIRPTDAATRAPGSDATEDARRLYEVIWKRFIACQMTHAEWESTSVFLERSDKATGAVFKATGRVLTFDGFYKVSGIPGASGDGDDQLPPLKQAQQVAPFALEPKQTFTAPPSRYSEASLIKKLEEEGIGRPSTYASIIETIRDRKYVEPDAGNLRASMVGEKVTEKMVEAFPGLMDLGYTRLMEAELDHVAEGTTNWRTMLKDFYVPFKDALDHAGINMAHAKAEAEPSPHPCPKCGGPTEYRFGKNGRFMGCTNFRVPPQEVTIKGNPGTWLLNKPGKTGAPALYKKGTEEKLGWMKLDKDEKVRLKSLAEKMPAGCDYITSVDNNGNPIGQQVTDIMAPPAPLGDGLPMVKRTGKFGAFLSAQTYPESKFILRLDPKRGTVVLPKPKALESDVDCPKCGKPLLAMKTKRGLWLYCSGFPKCRGTFPTTDLEPKHADALLKRVEAHYDANKPPVIRTVDGHVITGEEAYLPKMQK